MANQLWETSPHLALRAGSDFDLAALDRSSTPGFTGSKSDGKARLDERADLLSELQERLFAHSRHGGTRSVLLILQGLDTAGKGGIVRHVMGMVDPQGVALASFVAPTEEELANHYLWRIKKKLPQPGKIGVFDRSHYEDVLVVRVEGLVEEEVWRERYDEINAFEKEIVDSGTTIIKIALMHSKEEQAGRLLERIERPDKRWKLSPSDLDTRAKWDDYQEAYQDVFRLTSTEHAPWYVIPGDKKWYARVAVTELLTQALIDIDPQWPKPRWKPEVQRRRLLETVDPALVDDLVEAVEEQLKDAKAEHGDFLAEKARVAELRHRDNGHRAPSINGNGGRAWAFLRHRTATPRARQSRRRLSRSATSRRRSQRSHRRRSARLSRRRPRSRRSDRLPLRVRGVPGLCRRLLSGLLGPRGG
ncbi:PPK2 family polyphosphate kinase [Flaviflexus salsibiostraticola]|uniref:PPK2 family polyphosphate kinase n=1 Tax=Flaviflexus salsibiostraticola TaxID=1282737 RepID=UPI001B86C0B1|nr:PPK2 family polyphosphate kinase [Flaviflexus salsibiostraticola]